MLGHSHSALCWQGLKCRGSDLGRAGCIRCCARRLAPLNCCQTFNGRDSSNFADQTRRSPPTSPGRHQPNLFKSTSKHGATFEEFAVRAPRGALTLSGGLKRFATLASAVQTRRSLPRALDLFRHPSLRPLAEHHPTSHRGCTHRPLEPAEHVDALK